MFLFLRQRQSVSGGGAEREGAAESEAGSGLWAVSPEPDDTGIELIDCEIMTWAEVGHLTEGAPGCPDICFKISPLPSWNLGLKERLSE